MLPWKVAKPKMESTRNDMLHRAGRIFKKAGRLFDWIPFTASGLILTLILMLVLVLVLVQVLVQVLMQLLEQVLQQVQVHVREQMPRRGFAVIVCINPRR